jgi:hypothetical protein
MNGEAIANAARHHIGIGTTVRDRDLWHCGLGKTIVQTLPWGEIDSNPILPLSRRRI